MTSKPENDYNEVANILANLSTLITQNVYSVNDLVTAEKKFHDSICYYNIARNKLKSVGKKYGFNSNQYQKVYQEYQEVSIIRDIAQDKFNKIKKIINN
jgi:hypothetical protein